MRKIIILILALMGILNLQAQTAPYTVQLADAYWNFDNYDNTKMNCTSALQLVPQNWIAGTGGTSRPSAAYIPFIFPVSTSEEPDKGYDGRLCIRIYDNSTAARTPGFAVLPLISDAVYDTLELQFYGRGEVEQSSTGMPYHRRLCIGYITDLNDTLQANFKNAVVLFHDTVMPSASMYNHFAVRLRGIPAGARIALYNDEIYPDNNHKFCNSVLLDNIAFVGTGEAIEPSDPTGTAACESRSVNQGKKVLRDGKLLIFSPNGTCHTATGQVIR